MKRKYSKAALRKMAKIVLMSSQYNDARVPVLIAETSNRTGLSEAETFKRIEKLRSIK